MAHGVLLVSNESTTIQQVRSALSANGKLDARDVCASLAALRVRLEHDPTASAVVVDLDPDPLRMLSDLDPIIARHPGTRFLAVSNSPPDKLLVQAMQAGVRHVLGKQSIALDLSGAIQRLAGSRHGERPEGRLVAVLSAGGGCGATTVAVNLAHEMQQAGKQPVLIVDLDESYGGAGNYLGVEGRFGIADVLAEAERIDAELVRSTAQSHGEHLSILLSPATTAPLEPPTLKLANLDRTLDALRAASPLAVVDAPRLPLPATATLALSADATLIVLQMNVKDIRTARRLMAALSRRGALMSRMVAVVNRFARRRQLIRLADVRRALGDVHLECVRNDYRAASRAINYGQPLQTIAPRSALRKDIAVLARRLADAWARAASPLLEGAPR